MRMVFIDEMMGDGITYSYLFILGTCGEVFAVRAETHTTDVEISSLPC